MRRRRLAASFAGLALVAIVSSACNIPVAKWVPDFDGDGTISKTEVDRQTAVVIRAVAQAVEQHRRAVQQHPVLTCIRRHESDSAGGYSAQNAQQRVGRLPVHRQHLAQRVGTAGYPGYARAKYAPWFVQDAVALHTINHGGRSHWRGSGC
ncbi:MAG: hypothetical protein M5U19_17330 [Microthrixaceae bacterium]|nr:hypothetical protein [Microthrixaceae bacterium]